MNGFGWEGAIAGLVGGLLFEISRWLGLKKRRALPLYLHKLHYWLLTVLQIGAAGVTAGFLAPGGGAASFLVGLAGPALLSRLGILVLENLHLQAAPKAVPVEAPDDWLRG